MRNRPWKSTALVVALVFSYNISTKACDQHGTSGIVENNDLYIPVGQKSVSKLSEALFHKIISKIETLYKDEVKVLTGKTLKMGRNWTDGTVNAYAAVEGDKAEVNMFGGLARHSAVTPDGFALVVCHELGHHLGGAPKKLAGFTRRGAPVYRWATNEGQADYYGSMKCLREYFSAQNNVAFMARRSVPEAVTTKCEQIYTNAEEVAVCERTALAGLSLAGLFRSLRNQTEALKFNKKDKTTVTRTYDRHPEPQCRLDTYLAGALCDKDASLPVSQSDPETGVCSRKQGHTDGIRPLCWYSPGA